MTSSLRAVFPKSLLSRTQPQHLPTAGTTHPQMYSHAYAQPRRPTSSMSYRPVIPFDTNARSLQSMHRSKSTQTFAVSPASTWPRSSHNVPLAAVAQRPPLQQLANHAWSPSYKEYQPQYQYMHPPSSFRHQTQYSHAADMFNVPQSHFPPVPAPTDLSRKRNHPTSTWIGPDGNPKDIETLDREAEEEHRRRTSNYHPASYLAKQPLSQPPLNGYLPPGFVPNLTAVHAPGAPGGFVHPQQLNVLQMGQQERPAPARPSHDPVAFRDRPRGPDQFGKHPFLILFPVHSLFV